MIRMCVPSVDHETEQLFFFWDSMSPARRLARFFVLRVFDCAFLFRLTPPSHGVLACLPGFAGLHSRGRSASSTAR